MRRLIFLLVCLTFLPSLANAADQEASPELIFVEFDPWRMVIGSDWPYFALYSDGLVIYKKENTAPFDLVSAHLDEEQHRALLAALQLDSLSALNDGYDVSNYTDEPSYELHAWLRAERKDISVNGSIRTSPFSRVRLPPELLNAFDTVFRFSAEGAEPWQPDRLELMLWPFDHSRLEPVAWPSEWPGLEAASQRPSGLYQIFVPSDDYERLFSLLANLRDGRGVGLDNHTWSLDYRIPFPREADWAN